MAKDNSKKGTDARGGVIFFITLGVACALTIFMYDNVVMMILVGAASLILIAFGLLFVKARVPETRNCKPEQIVCEGDITTNEAFENNEKLNNIDIPKLRVKETEKEKINIPAEMFE